MIEDRWMKNAERVREICKTMGFKLVGFDPSWSITQGNAKLPNDPLMTWANNSIGLYMQIPDEFMATVSLMMGYGWDFNDSDENLKDSISQLDSMVKLFSKPSDAETFASALTSKNGNGKNAKKLISINAELKNMREADIQDYKQRIEKLKFVIETRNKLRNWSKDK